MNSVSDRIMKLFLEKKAMDFSFMTKALQLSSSKVAYHLSELQKAGIIEKVGNRYVLAEAHRSFLPYFDALLNQSKYPLIVVKIDVVVKGKHLLLFRKKEPFLGFWEIPATKLKLGESIKGAVKRILGREGEKGVISCPTQIRERILSDGAVMYDYFLYFVTIQLSSFKKIEGKGEFLSKAEWNPLRLIPTDKLFLEGKIRKKREIELILKGDELKLQTA